MTREEAIECLNFQNEKSFGGQSEALKMAISALSEELSEDGTLTVHISDGSKVNRVFVMGDNIFGGLYYPDSAENEGDLISRQAVEEINSEIPKIRELFDIAYEYNKEDSTRTELSQKCTTYLLDVWQTMSAIVDNFSSPFKGMTNGEILETIFPNCIDYKGCIEVKTHLDMGNTFRRSWWDSPYKGQDGMI